MVPDLCSSGITSGAERKCCPVLRDLSWRHGVSLLWVTLILITHLWITQFLHSIATIFSFCNCIFKEIDHMYILILLYYKSN